MDFEIVTALTFITIATMCLCIIVLDRKTRIKISRFDYLAIFFASAISSVSICFLGLVLFNI